MTSTKSHHEEYTSSNVVRTLHPSRPLSPPQKLIEYNNNNLDNLLDNLQSTVNKTAEHLNSANAAKSREVQFLSPSNSTSVVEERSSSPAGGNKKIYKSSRYEYSSSGTRGTDHVIPHKTYESVDPNVSSLDNLLDDLKQERKFPYEKDVDFSNVGIDSGLLEPNSSVSKTSRTVTTNNTGGSRPVNREINFDVPSLDTTPNSTINRSYNYSKTSSSTRSTKPYSTDIVEMDTTDLPADLKDVPISKDLLPGPGTKVTTTIKTFTYEIPNDTKVATNKNFSYKNEYYNSLNSSNTYYPERDVPAPTTTTHYTNESHNTVNRTENGMPTTLGPNQTYFYKKETNETKNNVYGSPRSLPPGNTTTMYESNVSNTQNVYHPPGGVTVYPDANLPPHQPGTKQTYLYKKETTNTTNTVYEPNGREYVPTPESATNKSYKYSSQSNTTNTHSRPEPIVAPFPTDAIHQPTQVDGPPKNLGQLLASFEEDTTRVDDEPYVPRKEVNTALASNQNKPITEPKAPTKNIAGPPVYYPPGQEMFAKSGAQAAWRAKGGYAKGSGNYEYEAESKSKSASKSGAAVVPVCLPLCCAMPCSIM